MTTTNIIQKEEYQKVHKYSVVNIRVHEKLDFETDSDRTLQGTLG